MAKENKNNEIYATEQRRIRMANLMARAYRERIKRLEAEIAKSRQEAYAKEQSHMNQENAASISGQEDKVLSPVLRSIENSLEKQAKLISELDEKIERNVYLPKDLMEELETAHHEPQNGLVFAYALSLSAIILIVRAIFMQFASGTIPTL